MPKLLIEIDHEFDASPMFAAKSSSNGGFKIFPLGPDELDAMLKDARLEEFSLGISLMNPEYGWPDFGFELPRKGLKKGGTFEWSIDTTTMRATVKVRGELTSPALRAGVAFLIKEMGDKADFRLQSFDLRGGERKGFTAPIHGQSDDAFNTWFKIQHWRIK